jgi:hypothetical protein
VLIHLDAFDHFIHLAIDEDILSGHTAVGEAGEGILRAQGVVLVDGALGLGLQIFEMLIIDQEVELEDVFVADAVGVAEEFVAERVEGVLAFGQEAAYDLIERGGLVIHLIR